MKKFLIIVLILNGYLANAVKITQFVAKEAGRSTNLIVWTAEYEGDITGYVIERNGIDVWEQSSGKFESAGYYYFDEPDIGLFSFYTLKVVYPGGRTEVRATTYVIRIWWRRLIWL